jgi:hypothetical protein
MRRSLKSITFMLVAPVICLGVLAAMGVEKSGYVKPENTDAYHADIREAIGLQIGRISNPEGQVPLFIGNWVGHADDIPAAAQQLLRPNAILSRNYVYQIASNRRHRQAGLLIVQCRDPRDMLGHYPPVCYKTYGETLDRTEPRDWKVGGLAIPGMAYEFSQSWQGRRSSRVVYNFLIVPGKGIVRDMPELSKASEFYQQRYWGAAQLQLVVPVDRSQPLTAEQMEKERAELDQIFEELVGPNVWIIEKLLHPERIQP